MTAGSQERGGVDELLANSHRGLARLRSTLDALDDTALAVVPQVGWGVAATLAHLAFYDDWVAERWRRYLSTGHLETLPDDITDLINTAASRGWQVVAPHAAKTIALHAAEDVTLLISRLPSAALDAAVTTGRLAMVDRALHWGPHLDEIDALANSGD